MNPNRLEEEYYNRIMSCYDRATKARMMRKFEIFACRELVSVMNEWKNPKSSVQEQEDLGLIARNTLLIMLNFFQTKKEEVLKKEERQLIKEIFTTVV